MAETTNTQTGDVGSVGEVNGTENANVEASGTKTAPVAGSETKTQAKGQIDDPDGENFDYEAWVEAQGLRGGGDKKAKQKADKKNAKSDENDSEETDDDTSDGNDNNQAKTKETDDNKNNSDKEIEIKLKVNGEERSVKGMDEITRLAQLGAASNEKFQEAAQIKREIQNVFETLATNPGKIFRHPTLGQKFREAAEKYIYEELQLESMPEHIREGELAKRRLAEMEQELSEQSEAQQAEEIQRQQQYFRQKFENDISQALRHGNLPQTPYNVRRTALHMQNAIENGYELTFDQLAELVRTDIMEEHKQLIANTPDVDTLINIIGKENVDRIRKHNIDKINKQVEANPKVLSRQTDKQASNNGGQRKFRSANEMIDAMRG